LASIALLLLLVLGSVACAGSPSASQPPTATVPAATPTPSCTPSPAPTPTPTAAPTATATPVKTPTPKPAPPPWSPPVPKAPLPNGKVVLVDLSDQWLFTYRDGSFQFANAVETGMPDLPTPTGHFSILSKQRDVTFVSPWPKGSPYWYAPTHVNYAMLFRDGGYYLHDASWHVWFGPGANTPHQLPDGRWETGSHGCVGMRVPDAQRLYGWVQLGTPVIVVR
jgi:lipoprotein-anchoring transpeptidase ErfK/SrfK